MDPQSGHKKHKKKKKKRKRSSSSDEEDSRKHTKTKREKHHKESDSSDSEERRSKKKCEKKEGTRPSRESEDKNCGGQYNDLRSSETDRVHGEKRGQASDTSRTDRHHSETHRHSSAKHMRRNLHETKMQSREDERLEGTEKNRHRYETSDKAMDRRHSETHKSYRDTKTDRHYRINEDRHLSETRRQSRNTEGEFEKSKDSRCSGKRQR